MTEQASITLTAGQPGLGTLPSRTRVAKARKVAGKSQLVVSAFGMVFALTAALDGKFLVAAFAFLLTVGILEVMFQRALARFHASCGRLYRRPGTALGTALGAAPEPGLSGD